MEKGGVEASKIALSQEVYSKNSKKLKNNMIKFKFYSYIFAFMLLANIPAQAQEADFDWQYITSYNLKTPLHIPKEYYQSISSVPLSESERDKYFIPLLAKQANLYGKNYQVVIVGKLELGAGKRAILYAIYPFQDETRFVSAYYFLATFEQNGKGIGVEPITSYQRMAGKPGGISILKEGEIYTVYVAEWEAGEFSKTLKIKFDTQGKFIQK